jgi:hypothetical protein
MSYGGAGLDDRTSTAIIIFLDRALDDRADVGKLG